MRISLPNVVEYRQFRNTNYWVGDDGSVLSRTYGEEKLLRPSKNTSGYYHFSVPDGPYKQKTIKVHSAILECFVGPRPGGMHGCHRDNCCTNNQLGNLRWDTPQGNRLDSNANVLTPNKAKLVAEMLERGDRMEDIASWLQISFSTVSAVNTGETWSEATGAVPGERIKKTRKAKVHLSAEQWAAVKQMLDDGYDMSQVAEQFDITKMAIYYQRRRNF